MKRIGLLSFVAALAFQVGAQTNQDVSPSPDSRWAEKHLMNLGSGLASPKAAVKKYTKQEMEELGALAAPGDTLYNFDFSNSSNWRFTNAGTNGWRIVTTTGQQSWYYPQTSLASSSGFPYLSLNPGNPNPAPPAATHFAETQAPINLSGDNFVHLVYSWKHERFQDTLQVQVSGNGGSTWTTIDDNQDYVATTQGTPTRNPNPDIRRFNISAIAGGQANVVVRFRWRSRADGSPNDGIGYGALIDDVMILKAPHSDIDLNFNYTNGALDSGSNEFYSVIPARQAKDWEMKIGSDVFNNGRSVQTRARLNIEATADNGFSYTGSSNIATLSPGTTQKMEDASFFKPNDGPGNYSVRAYPTSDSNLTNLANDTVAIDFIVSDSVFARDVASVSENNDGWSYNPSAVSDFQLGNVMEIRTLDTVKGFMFYVSQFNRPSQSVFTSSIEFAIFGFDENAGTVTQQPLFVSDNPNPPDAANPQRYAVTSSMIGEWVFFPATSTTSNIDTIGPGTYWVVYEGNHTAGGDTLRHAYGGNFELFNRALARSNSGNFFSFINRKPAVRLVTQSFQCPDLKSNVSSQPTTACGASDGSATVNPVNGEAPFNYAWGGGTIGGGQGTATATGLSSGIYSVTVTDKNGCSETIQVTISDAGAPVVTAQNIADEQCFGDLDGSIKLSLSGGSAQSYDYTWKNSSGNIVLQGIDEDSLGGVAAGVYTVEVIDPNPGGCKSVASFTIGGPSTALELPSPLSAGVLIEDVECNGDGDGEISIAAATGGTGSPSSFTYSWTKLNDPSFSASGLNLTGLDGGRYTCEVTDGNGCTDSQPYLLAEPDPIDIGPSVASIPQQGKSQVSTSITGGEAPYDCVFYGKDPDGKFVELRNITDTITIQAFSFSTRYFGEYKAVVTDDNGCSTEESFFVENDQNHLIGDVSIILSLNSQYLLTSGSMAIMPNPNNGSFKLRLPRAAKGSFDITIKNTLGQSVYESSKEVNNDIIDLSNTNLDNGVYFINAKDESGKEFTGRFIVE